MLTLQPGLGRSVTDTLVAENPGFSRWMTRHDDAAPSSSNQPSLELPFQRWFKFKEAFSPRFILDCFDIYGRSPRRCIDCFGGSGTTALTCQFAGVEPITIEVNPFLADLIEAKLCTYDLNRLQRDFLGVCRSAPLCRLNVKAFFGHAPKTMVEPGVKGRWIFSRDAAKTIAQYRVAIKALTAPKSRLLLRVVLGSVLIELSNAVVNGKGRRYRSNWKDRQVTAEDVERSFTTAFENVFSDLCQFPSRQLTEFTLLRGDSRKLIKLSGPFDVAVFSPPYPNSFDYTDIYNIELWMLGYLRSSAENRRLRTNTLRSHVQIRRELDVQSITPALRLVYAELCAKRDDLWDSRLPEMVNSYFADMRDILVGIRENISDDGMAFMAVGNSQYAGVLVDVPAILGQICKQIGFKVRRSNEIRSMRTSAQQGGRHELTESLVVLSPK